eukprot:scaffold496_cov236-Pinguiococcus_pyrenoidosus.AAC.3
MFSELDDGEDYPWSCDDFMNPVNIELQPLTTAETHFVVNQIRAAEPHAEALEQPDEDVPEEDQETRTMIPMERYEAPSEQTRRCGCPSRYFVSKALWIQVLRGEHLRRARHTAGPAQHALERLSAGLHRAGRRSAGVLLRADP